MTPDENYQNQVAAALKNAYDKIDNRRVIIDFGTNPPKQTPTPAPAPAYKSIPDLIAALQTHASKYLLDDGALVSDLTAAADLLTAYLAEVDARND